MTSTGIPYFLGGAHPFLSTSHFFHFNSIHCFSWDTLYTFGPKMSFGSPNMRCCTSTFESQGGIYVTYLREGGWCQRSHWLGGIWALATNKVPPPNVGLQGLGRVLFRSKSRKVEWEVHALSTFSSCPAGAPSVSDLQLPRAGVFSPSFKKSQPYTRECGVSQHMSLKCLSPNGKSFKQLHLK